MTRSTIQKQTNHFFSGDVTTPRAMECGDEQGGSTSSNRSSCLDDTGKMVSRLFLEVLNLKRHIKVDIPLNEAVRAAVRAAVYEYYRALPAVSSTKVNRLVILFFTQILSHSTHSVGHTPRQWRHSYITTATTWA